MKRSRANRLANSEEPFHSQSPFDWLKASSKSTIVVMSAATESESITHNYWDKDDDMGLFIRDFIRRELNP